MRSPVKTSAFSSVGGRIVRNELSNSMPPDEVVLRWCASVPLPTEITHGAAEYGFSAISVLELPAAKTTTMPAPYIERVAWLIGSSGLKRRKDDPHELFTTRTSPAEMMSSNAVRTLKTNTASPVP